MEGHFCYLSYMYHSQNPHQSRFESLSVIDNKVSVSQSLIVSKVWCNCLQLYRSSFCSFITSDCFGISGRVFTTTVCTNPFSSSALFSELLVKGTLSIINIQWLFDVKKTRPKKQKNNKA